MDLGCGYFNNKLWNIDDINIDGFDIDYKLILNKPELKNKIFFIQDISKKWENKSNIILQENKELLKYNYIFSLMSIHNSFQNNLSIQNFFE